jgi:hypothetical protein
MSDRVLQSPSCDIPQANISDYLQVLRSSAPKGCQLPQEEVWSQQPAEAQEEDQELECH